MKKTAFLIFLLFSIFYANFVFSVQWCVKNDRPCYKTPEEVCQNHLFGITAQVCSRVYGGITAHDEYGPAYAVCTTSHDGTDGICGNGNDNIHTNDRAIYRKGACPAGGVLDSNGLCIEYVAIAPINAPQTQHCSGNPIDTITGKKIQTESIVSPRKINQISFSLTYAYDGAKSRWRHNYQRKLELKKGDPEFDVISSNPYSTKSGACASGFNDLKASISAPWTQGSTVQWDSATESCVVVKNGFHLMSLKIDKYPATFGFVLPELFMVTREDGSQIALRKTAPDTYSSLNGSEGIIKKTGTELEPQLEHHKKSGEIDTYNKSGQLIAITAASKVKQELFYDETSKLLSRVIDSAGRELHFTYTGTQLTGVTVDAKTTNFAYNETGMLSSITHPNETTRQYHYEDARFPEALTGITDERNKRYATWAYDDQGRAISSEHAGGADKTLLSFNNNVSTTVTNPLGKKTQYFYSYIAGANRIVHVEGEPTASCEGANQTYSYTNEGLLESKTDWKGIQTQYQYNGLGQETSRTEAFGTPEARTIRTEWHPTLYLKTKITEPGKETTFSYDANGRLLNQSTHAVNN